MTLAQAWHSMLATAHPTRSLHPHAQCPQRQICSCPRFARALGQTSGVSSGPPVRSSPAEFISPIPEPKPCFQPYPNCLSLMYPLPTAAAGPAYSFTGTQVPAFFAAQEDAYMQPGSGGFFLTPFKTEAGSSSDPTLSFQVSRISQKPVVREYCAGEEG